MPAKKPQVGKEPQIKKFRRLVREKIAAGELNPTEADAALDRLVKKSIKDHGA
jgi:hypothetical protein